MYSQAYQVLVLHKQMEVDLAEKVLSSFLFKVLALSSATAPLSAHTLSETHTHIHTPLKPFCLY